MQRIFSSYAYGAGPRTGCWWDETCDMPTGDPLDDTACDVAIVGGGFTGITAALWLARAGVRVSVFEAEHFGWGASGRNGGFCCLGGGKASDAELDARFGKEGRLAYRAAEASAVAYVEAEIATLGLDVDRHSDGETELAHSAGAMEALRRDAEQLVENYNIEPELTEKRDLAEAGFGGGPFFGALTVPIGFGLNPRKYLAGLVKGARAAGAALFERAAVLDVRRARDGFVLVTGGGEVRASQVVFATNGYSSENVPRWLAGRYMPSQSTVLVTRPLTEAELDAQGWHSAQMSSDTRNLLHYFRLMPDRRFLFGMRGGLMSGAWAEASARANTRAHFERMFPEWSHVESHHIWSGFVSLARDKLPFAGPVPGAPGAWAALCYHGNGVAMGSYAGRLLAEVLSGAASDACPEAMRQPLTRFPFGRARRVVMPPLYAGLMLSDAR